MERVDLLIKNGDVVFREGTRPANLAISDGKVAAILKPGLEIDAARVVDAAGKHVLPGLVDPEGHPGHSFPLDIDFETESPAAAAAGVTTWGIQDPSPRMGKKPFVQDTRPEDVVSFHDVMDIAIKTGEENCITDFYFTPQLETDQQAEEIVEYAEKYGVTSYKFYCHAKHPHIAAKLWYVYRSGLATGFDDGVVYKTLENVARIGPPGIVSFHPENFEIVRVFSQRLMDAGRMDMEAWTDRSPDFVEAHHMSASTPTSRRSPSVPCMSSTRPPASRCRPSARRKDEGVEIYAQSNPVYLCLPAGTWKINVPLRYPETMELLVGSLQERRDRLPGVGPRGVARHPRRDGGARRRLEDHQRLPLPGRDDAAVDARRRYQQGQDHAATAGGDDVRGPRQDIRPLPAARGPCRWAPTEMW